MRVKTLTYSFSYDDWRGFFMNEKPMTSGDVERYAPELRELFAGHDDILDVIDMACEPAP